MIRDSTLRLASLCTKGWFPLERWHRFGRGGPSQISFVRRLSVDGKVQTMWTSHLADSAEVSRGGHPHLNLLRMHKLGPPRPNRWIRLSGFA